MQMKTWIASVGLGALAGAATVFLMPKHSEAYQMANDAAHTLKMEAGKMMDSIKRR